MCMSKALKKRSPGMKGKGKGKGKDEDVVANLSEMDKEVLKSGAAKFLS